MTTPQDTEEILDLVDANDKVIGSVSRRDVQRLGMQLKGYVRAVDCFIFNRKKQIWVPRRTPDKFYAPNGLDFSVGEHVQAGETYEQAIVRGFREELGIVVDPAKLECVGKIDWRERGTAPYFSTLYVYRSDDTPSYNKEDFVSDEWISPRDLKQRLKNGEVAKTNLALSLEFCTEKMEDY